MRPFSLKSLMELILLIPLVLMAAVLALLHNFFLMIVRFLHASFIELGKMARWLYHLD